MQEKSNIVKKQNVEATRYGNGFVDDLDPSAVDAKPKEEHKLKLIKR